MTPQEIAAAILRDVLTGPKRWTRGAYARNWYGMPVGPESHNAECWCISGAARRVCDEMTDRDVLFVDVERIAGVPAPEFNDARETTFDDVRRVLETIARAA